MPVIAELTMGPCRDFGELSLEDIAKMPVPSGLPAHLKHLAERFTAEGQLGAEDAAYIAKFADTLAVAPGYLRFLGEDKKREEALRLYGIARRLRPVVHPRRDDLLLAIGIILFNIAPSEKLISRLSGLRPSGPLSYEYHAMLAMNHLMLGSLDAAAFHAESALNAAPDRDRQAYVSMLKACISLRQGDPESAIRCMEYSADRNDRLRALASFYAGIVRYEHRDFEDALRYFEAAGESARDVLDVLAVRCNVGACAVNTGDMFLGEREFDTVDRLIRNEGGPRAARRKLLANSYMGIISRVRGEYAEAEGYYKKALKSCVQLNDMEGIANQLGNMGILYRHTGDHSIALRLLNTCLLYSERMGYLEGVHFSCENIFTALVEIGQDTEARKFKETYASRYPGL